MNDLKIRGTLISKDGVRSTIGGYEVFSGEFLHRSEQQEAGQMRTLEFTFTAKAFGEIAHELNQVELGTDLSVAGFIAPRSARSKTLIVHITEFLRS